MVLTQIIEVNFHVHELNPVNLVFRFFEYVVRNWFQMWLLFYTFLEKIKTVTQHKTHEVVKETPTPSMHQRAPTTNQRKQQQLGEKRSSSFRASMDTWTEWHSREAAGEDGEEPGGGEDRQEARQDGAEEENGEWNRSWTLLEAATCLKRLSYIRPHLSE